MSPTRRNLTDVINGVEDTNNNDQSKQIQEIPPLPKPTSDDDTFDEFLSEFNEINKEFTENTEKNLQTGQKKYEEFLKKTQYNEEKSIKNAKEMINYLDTLGKIVPLELTNTKHEIKDLKDALQVKGGLKTKVSEDDEERFENILKNVKEWNDRSVDTPDAIRRQTKDLSNVQLESTDQITRAIENQLTIFEKILSQPFRMMRNALITFIFGRKNKDKVLYDQLGEQKRTTEAIVETSDFQKTFLVLNEQIKKFRKQVGQRIRESTEPTFEKIEDLLTSHENLVQHISKMTGLTRGSMKEVDLYPKLQHFFSSAGLKKEDLIKMMSEKYGIQEISKQNTLQELFEKLLESGKLEKPKSLEQKREEEIKQQTFREKLFGFLENITDLVKPDDEGKTFFDRIKGMLLAAAGGIGSIFSGIIGAFSLSKIKSSTSKIGKLAKIGIVNRITRWFDNIILFLNNLKNIGNFKKFSKGMKLSSSQRKLLATSVRRISNVFSVFSKVSKSTGKLASAVGTATKAGKIAGVMSRALIAIGWVLFIFDGMIGATKALFQTRKLLEKGDGDPITRMDRFAVGISGFIGGLFSIFDLFTGPDSKISTLVTKTLVDLYNQIIAFTKTPIFREISYWINVWYETFAGPIRTFFKDTMAFFTSEIIPELQNLFEEMKPTLIVVGGIIASIITIIAGTLGPLLGSLVTALKHVVIFLLRTLKFILKTLTNSFASLNKWIMIIAEVFTNFGNAIYNLFTGNFSGYVAYFDKFWNNVGKLISTYFTNMYNIFKNFFEIFNLDEEFGAVFNYIKKNLIKFFDPLLELIEKLKTYLFDTIKKFDVLGIFSEEKGTTKAESNISEERMKLGIQLGQARREGDEEEVKRITAKLRKLIQEDQDYVLRTNQKFDQRRQRLQQGIKTSDKVSQPVVVNNTSQQSKVETTNALMKPQVDNLSNSGLYSAAY